ncbi:MAG: SIS domain-containing protein [Victivallales bacterium]|nr:SIS domain-containing protein [Victivallales bacterium]
MNPLEILLENYPQLAGCRAEIEQTAKIIIDCQAQGGTLFTCGNGGSCADADHISGELLKGFCRKRPMTSEERAALAAESPEVAELLGTKLQRGLRCISLMNFPGAGSAVRNDLGGDLDVAQVLYALGRPGDVLLGISTSGNAKNVRYAVAVARLKGMKVLGLTGEGGGTLGELADVVVRVPSRETYRIQEYHLPIYHAMCQMVENHFFAE